MGQGQCGVGALGRGLLVSLLPVGASGSPLRSPCTGVWSTSSSLLRHCQGVEGLEWDGRRRQVNPEGMWKMPK